MCVDVERGKGTISLSLTKCDLSCVVIFMVFVEWTSASVCGGEGGGLVACFDFGKS